MQRAIWRVSTVDRVSSTRQPLRVVGDVLVRLDILAISANMVTYRYMDCQLMHFIYQLVE